MTVISRSVVSRVVWLGVALLLIAGAMGLLVRVRRVGGRPRLETSDVCATPLASPFLNTRPDASYVGSAACRSCHEEQSASFRRTGMGRSMAEVQADREPPD